MTDEARRALGWKSCKDEPIVVPPGKAVYWREDDGWYQIIIITSNDAAWNPGKDWDGPPCFCAYGS